MNIDEKEKQDIINKYVNNNYSIAKLCKEYSLHNSIIYKIFDEYNIKIREHQYKYDLTNDVIGDFTVIGFDETKGKYKYYWLCKCNNCGKIKSISQCVLTNDNKNKYCECNSKFNTPKDIKGYKDDLTGKVFGKLTVIKFFDNKNSHSRWLCRCECGKEVVKSISYLNNSKYKMCDECLYKLKHSNTPKKVKTEKVKIPFEDISYQKKENKYEIIDDYVLINDKVLIDLDDLEKIKSFQRYVSVNNGGYALMWYKNRELFLHRLIMSLPQDFDTETRLIADHINGNRLDNRKSNLRILHHSQNPINCKVYKNNTSGHKGVHYNKNLNKYQVDIQINKEKKYLGVYSDYDEAVKVREQAEKKYFGELNRKVDKNEQ